MRNIKEKRKKFLESFLKRKTNGGKVGSKQVFFEVPKSKKATIFVAFCAAFCLFSDLAASIEGVVLAFLFEQVLVGSAFGNTAVV